MAFDFDTQVNAPFRMQPGLRRIEPGTPQLTPMHPGSRAQREKLAVFWTYAPQALCATPDFDARPALSALCAEAAQEQPQAWTWDGRRATSPQQGVACDLDGRTEPLARGRYGCGDELTRCLAALPPAWRLPALLGLSFEEDFALVDAAAGTIPWLAVALPSHWAPEHKVGRDFAAIHAPVADNRLLVEAGAGLLRLVAGATRWQRCVWSIADDPHLHAHPARETTPRWQRTRVDQAWFRTEHQTFIPLPARRQAWFTIQVQVRPLVEVLDTPARAARLHAAIASMSEAVIAYRGLTAVRGALLAWLAQRAA
ncbi:MAG: DUF3445 domain-containing protein [Burkholderiales bacterium]|nr:DUF3445 domain-containing protein [Burkholderiales bacterium]MDE1929410.1 DUF3445 domain-containing protein [Burkholderiales bacterium]MDE2159584.1 DUF3445 domain-containing protein [Burkholderiales bacterium]MDE2501651.1 DUF3445 domain-containing protein [Burkholderiales bacterium]